MKSFILVIAALMTISLHAAEGQSRANREDKTWSWFGSVGNFTLFNYAMFGFGAGASLFLSPDDVVSFEAGTASNYDFLSSIAGDTVTGHRSWAGASYKRFVASSFYLKAGVEATNVHYRVQHYWTTDSSQTADIRIYSATFGLGNQWQFKTFTLGCDWAAVVLPFANAGFSETDEGPVTNPWDLKQRLTAVGVNLVRFYLGMSF